MTNVLQLLAVTISILLLVLVLELVRRKKLTEEYSFIWIVAALALLGIALGRRLIDAFAIAIGIYYPPAALLLVLVLFVFVAALSFSVVVSRQRQQIERLIEDTALMDLQLRELRSAQESTADAAASASRPGNASGAPSAS